MSECARPGCEAHAFAFCHSFDANKKAILTALYGGCKSPKGSVDAPIVEFVHYMNTQMADIVTASSCSGRISVFLSPGGAATGGLGAKGTGQWLLAAHHNVTTAEVSDVLATAVESAGESDLVTLKMEPFLLHVEARHEEAARWFLAAAHSAGFRESGAMWGKNGGRVMVHVRTTAHSLEVPLLLGKQLLVQGDALDAMVRFANQKFNINTQRIERLWSALRDANDVRMVAATRSAQAAAGHPAVALPVAWAGSMHKPLGEAQWPVPGLKMRSVSFACLPADAAAAVAEMSAHSAEGSAGAPSGAAATVWQDPPRKQKKDKKTGQLLPLAPAEPVLLTVDNVTAVPLVAEAAATLRAFKAEHGSAGTDSTDAAALLPVALRPFAAQLAAAPWVAVPNIAVKPKLSGGKRAKGTGAATAAGATGADCAGAAGASSVQGVVADPVGIQGVTALSRLHHALRSHAHAAGSPAGALDGIPRKADVFGNALMLGQNELRHPVWKGVWPAVAAAVGVDIVARRAEVSASPTRDSLVTLLHGQSPWVNVKENGVLYTLDITKCMFSRGNVTEKARMAAQPAAEETIVDLFAGIGYFTIPLAKFAGAAKVMSIDWNPAATEALRRNVAANKVEHIVSVFDGDNEQMRSIARDCADRVMLGLIPSSERGWPVAVAVLKPSGGVMHVHGNVPTTEASRSKWGAHVAATIKALGAAQGKEWYVTCTHVEKVKSYAPRVVHAVADIKCVAAGGAPSPVGTTAPPAEESTTAHAASPAAAAAEGCSAPPALPAVPDPTAGTPAVLREDRAAVDAAVRETLQAPWAAAGTPPCFRAEALLGGLANAHEQLWTHRTPMTLKAFVGADVLDAFEWKVFRAACSEGGSCSADGAAQVAVHSSDEPALRFAPTKNFKYATVPLAFLLEQAEAKAAAADSAAGVPFMYLRAIGKRPRKDAADFWQDFPQVSRLLSWRAFQRWVPAAQYFSSVLRVMAPGMSLWTHYDVRDNILLQLCGTKRVTVFPVTAAQHMALLGSTGTVLHSDDAASGTVESATLRESLWSAAAAAAAAGHCSGDYGIAAGAALTVELHPGDALFIPSCVPHCVSVPASSGPSVGVNVFWHDPRLPPAASAGAGKDVYGNHDPAAVKALRSSLPGAVDKALNGLPQDYQAFYRGVLSADVRMAAASK